MLNRQHEGKEDVNASAEAVMLISNSRFRYAAEVTKKDKLIAQLRRRLRGSAQTAVHANASPDSWERPGVSSLSLSHPAAFFPEDDSLDLDEFIESMRQLETSVEQSSEKVAQMVGKSREAVKAIDDIKNGVKGKVLGIADVTQDSTWRAQARDATETLEQPDETQ
jgi:hypothetical protein